MSSARRSRPLSVTVALLATSAWDAPAAAQEAEPPPSKHALALRFDAGPGLRALVGHQVWGVELDAALGGEFGRIVRGKREPVAGLYGTLGLLHGETDGGLGATLTSVGIAVEPALGRVRLQIGLQGKGLSVARFTRHERMWGVGAALGLGAGVDLAQGDWGGLYLATRGEIGRVGEVTVGGGSLKLGGRFVF